MIDQDIDRRIVSISETVESRFYGKYRGIVVKVGNSREDLGNITVKIPDVFHDQEIQLAKPYLSFTALPFAGKNWGFAAFPKKDDGIWIEFEAGNQNKPIWTGGFWMTKEEIPNSTDWETICLVSRTGHKIIIDDKNRKISIIHSNGPEINLTGDEISFIVGRTKMVISQAGVNINDKSFEVKTS